MDTIHFVESTIRDGHQSLWAENMREKKGSGIFFQARVDLAFSGLAKLFAL